MHMRVVVVAALVAAAAARPSGPAWKGIKVAEGDKMWTYDSAPHANYTDKSMHPTEYQTMARSGTKFGSNTFGAHVDQNNVENGKYSNNPDFTSILTKYNGKLYSITHFEAPQPATAYFSELNQDKDGKLSIQTTMPLDFKKYGGLWIPCAGSVSPMGSHMGSEEYEPDARKFTQPDAKIPDNHGGRAIMQHMPYFGKTATTYKEASEGGFNPYHYGYAWECTVKTDGKPDCVKHRSMGRMSWELPYVMPDRKTVYGTDDGTDVVFTMFKAAKAGDLSDGELFCARMQQQTPLMPEKGKEAGSADKFMATVRWISMGKAKDADVDKALTDWNSTKAGFTFNTVFKTVNVKDGKCEDGYTMIQAGGNDPECLKLAFKDTKLQAIAARLETRRMAAFLGCTTEFRKWEGFTYDPIGRVAYTSISEVSTGMEVGPSFRDHIQVKKNLCGCVMEMGFNGDEDYQISWIKSLECGKSANETAYKAISEEYYKTNKCDVNFIASPDNVAFIPEYNQLLIGEDTDMHRNNVIWSRDMKTGKLTRILSTPVGAETTGPYWYPNINGFSYITAVIQHPFDSTYDKDKASKSPEGAEDALRGYVGYLGPLPTVSKVYSAAFSTAATVVLSTVVAFAVALFSL